MNGAGGQSAQPMDGFRSEGFPQEGSIMGGRRFTGGDGMIMGGTQGGEPPVPTNTPNQFQLDNYARRMGNPYPGAGGFDSPGGYTPVQSRGGPAFGSQMAGWGMGGGNMGGQAPQRYDVGQDMWMDAQAGTPNQGRLAGLLMGQPQGLAATPAAPAAPTAPARRRFDVARDQWVD